MNRTALFALVASFALLAGCSGGDGEISVEAAAAPPTDNGNDALFTLKIDEAPADGYALEGLTVKAIQDGKDAISVSCTTTDANANAKLDAGDSLVCTEGATNILGADAAGTEIDVELYAKVDGEDTLVGEATWTPAK